MTWENSNPLLSPSSFGAPLLLFQHLPKLSPTHVGHLSILRPCATSQVTQGLEERGCKHTHTCSKFPVYLVRNIPFPESEVVHTEGRRQHILGWLFPGAEVVIRHTANGDTFLQLVSSRIEKAGGFLISCCLSYLGLILPSQKNLY